MDEIYHFGSDLRSSVYGVKQEPRARFVFNLLYKDVDFVFICLIILKSMIRKEVDYHYFHIDLSFETNRLS